MAKQGYPSWCCQTCGAPIGWVGRVRMMLGRFGLFPHRCKEISNAD